MLFASSIRSRRKVWCGAEIGILKLWTLFGKRWDWMSHWVGLILLGKSYLILLKVKIISHHSSPFGAGYLIVWFYACLCFIVMLLMPTFPWQRLLEFIASSTHRHCQQPSKRWRWSELITYRLLVLALSVAPLTHGVHLFLRLVCRSSENIIDVEITEEALFVIAVCYWLLHVCLT